MAQQSLCKLLFTAGIVMAVLLLFGISSCQKIANSDLSYGPELQAGAQLVLHRKLTIPSERASLYIQDGEVRPHKAVDQYYPHCKFEVLDIKTRPQTIEPDTFIIKKITREPDYLGGTQPGRYATAGKFQISDGSSPYNYATLLYLNSTRQPRVHLLVCSHWEDPTDASHLTLQQIRHTLGSIFSLNPSP